MTEAMPFLQKAILLSYAPRPLAGGRLFVHMGSGRSDLSQFGVLAERRGIEGGSQEGPLLYIILKRSFS